MAQQMPRKADYNLQSDTACRLSAACNRHSADTETGGAVAREPDGVRHEDPRLPSLVNYATHNLRCRSSVVDGLSI